MSGYLQRMISSALKPGGSIHPLLGSVFAPPTDTRPFESGQEESGSVSEVGVDSASASMPQASFVSQDVGADTAATGMAKLQIPNPLVEYDQARSKENSFLESNSNSGPPKVVNTKRESGPPVPDVPVNESATQAEAPRKLHGAMQRMSVPHLSVLKTPTMFPEISERREHPISHPAGRGAFFHSESKANHSNVEEAVIPTFRAASTDGDVESQLEQIHEQRERASSLGKTFEPLIAEELPSTGLGALPIPFSSFGGADRKRERLIRAAATESETSEIQIHIGRIEVTAVPSTPVRQVSKPARKSMSLDEYLKRRNGRG